MEFYIDQLIEQHKNAIKMLKKITTYNEPKAKPYYTKFMFITEPILPNYAFIDDLENAVIIDEPVIYENAEVIEPIIYYNAEFSE